MAGGLVVVKKEMTKFWVNNAFVPVTLVKVVPQEIVRYKSEEKDGYSAVVIGVGKKETGKEKGNKIDYKMLTEFAVTNDFAEKFEAGAGLDIGVLEGIDLVSVVGVTKGKGYQGVVKRFHVKGGNKTHGSKFHRGIGSVGNRKPRRTQKGHPHAGRMGGDRKTLKNITIVDRIVNDEQILAVKGSLPGAYNSLLKIVIG